MLILMWSNLAHGFCGTYVGGPGAQLANRSSQVVLAREDTRTTLTLVADYQGDPSQFALVLPVPRDLDPETVLVVDPGEIELLDTYSAPRRIAYTCDDAIHVDLTNNLPAAGCAMTLGCSAELGGIDGFEVLGPPEEALGAVTVEAQFTVADYDIVILTAEGAGGLEAWLDLNGYAIPSGGGDILQEYIDSGVSFLAAKVSLEATDDARATRRLPPLQMAYDSDFFGLPIRIGTISAAGPQEVVIYAITDPYAGRARILNYPEIQVEDECMWPASEHESFARFYQEELEKVAAEGASWQTEYSWTMYLPQPTTKCDPCTVPPEELYDEGEFAPLGFVGPAAHLTRMRMTYEPHQVPEDLSIGLAPLDGNLQLRYVEYERDLEFLFPICGQGYVDVPGQCGDGGVVRPSGSSRAAAPIAAGGLFLLMWLVSRRRRS